MIWTILLVILATLGWALLLLRWRGVPLVLYVYLVLAFLIISRFPPKLRDEIMRPGE